MLILIILGACTSPDQSRQVESKPMNVKIQRVETINYQVPVRVTGVLGTTTQMKLSFKTGGIISQLNCQGGDGSFSGRCTCCT